MGMVKNCDNCIYSGRPSYKYPCTDCETAYGSEPSKWEGMVPATADMVEVVRCKDCKYCDFFYPTKEIGKEPIPAWYCRPQKSNRKPDDFCSYGERKTDV